MMLHQLCGNDDPRCIPALEICWKSDVSDTQHIVSGVVSWDGKTLPKNPKRIMRRLFEGDDQGYFIARAVGEIAVYDGKVMKAHGLAYRAAHFIGKGGKDRGYWCNVKEGRIAEERMRGKVGRRIRPMPEFLNRNQRYLIDLVNWFRSLSFGI
jgi:hypothetical protein